jgi:hypothetical protein
MNKLTFTMGCLALVTPAPDASSAPDVNAAQ